MVEPKIRFQRDDGTNYPGWKEMPLSALVTDNLDPVPTPQGGYRRVGVYCHAKGTFQEDVTADKILDVDTMYRIHKDNLIVNITFAWEHAVAIVKPEDEGLLVSHRFPEYSFNAGQVPGFYKYLILRPYFKNKLSLASPGGAGRNRVLNKAQFKEIIVTVPCEEEQKKIANFLSSVDEVIVAGEREVANLETQKKAAMKKIFSQEVRFKRKDGTDFPKWEEQCINDFCKVSSGEFVIKTKQDDSFPYPVFNGGTENTGYYSEYNYDGSYILMSSRGANAGYVNKHIGKLWCGNSCYAVRIVDDAVADFDFLYHAFKYHQYDFLSNQQTGSIPAVNKGQLEDFILSVPTDFEEQCFIADFLSNFDEAIAAAKKELELWKELKKGLLQQMFV